MINPSLFFLLVGMWYLDNNEVKAKKIGKLFLWIAVLFFAISLLLGEIRFQFFVFALLGYLGIPKLKQASVLNKFKDLFTPVVIKNEESTKLTKKPSYSNFEEQIEGLFIFFIVLSLVLGFGYQSYIEDWQSGKVFERKSRHAIFTLFVLFAYPYRHIFYLITGLLGFITVYVEVKRFILGNKTLNKKLLVRLEARLNNLNPKMSTKKWIDYVIRNRSHAKFIIFQTQENENMFVQFSTIDGSLLLDIPANDYNKRMKIIDKAIEVIKSLKGDLQCVMGDDGEWRSLNVSLRRNEDLASVLVDRILSECYGLKNYSLRVVVG